MKKTIVVILLFLIGYRSEAQITVQPLLPSQGLFQKEQLWNILAINSSSYPQQCYVVLSLQDRQSGREIMSATSTSFTLEKGSKQLNEANLTPIQYTDFAFDDKSFLPVGSYMACFKLIGAGHESGQFSESCVPFDVAPLSPPMLILPADSSVLQTAPSQFTWQPPAPLTMFQQLHYEILIAEIAAGQRPEEAVELNTPLYIDLNVPTSFMNYSGAYPSFEQGKWYAWQVVAQDGGSYAAKTPVWDFKVSQPDVPAVVPLSTNYIILSNEKSMSEGINILSDNTAHIKYYSFDKDHSGTMNFIGPDGKILESTTIQLAYGDNYLTYKLGNKFKKGTTYSIQITDNKKNKNIAFFLIK
jgi:hypothetical protein